MVSFEGDLRRYFDPQFHHNMPKKRAVCWPIHFYSTKDLGMSGLEADQLGIVWAALLARCGADGGGVARLARCAQRPLVWTRQTRFRVRASCRPAQTIVAADGTIVQDAHRSCDARRRVVPSDSPRTTYQCVFTSHHFTHIFARRAPGPGPGPRCLPGGR